MYYIFHVNYHDQHIDGYSHCSYPFLVSEICLSHHSHEGFSLPSLVFVCKENQRYAVWVQNGYKGSREDSIHKYARR